VLDRRVVAVGFHDFDPGPPRVVQAPAQVLAAIAGRPLPRLELEPRLLADLQDGVAARQGRVRGRLVDRHEADAEPLLPHRTGERAQ